MNNEIVFYSTPDGDKKVEVLFQDENFWLTQKALAGLFNVKVPAVNKHLKNIFEPQKRAHSPLLAAGLASESKNSKLHYGRRFPLLAAGSFNPGN